MVEKASETKGKSTNLQNRIRAKVAERENLQNRYENRLENDPRILKKSVLQKASEIKRHSKDI